MLDIHDEVARNGNGASNGAGCTRERKVICENSIANVGVAVVADGNRGVSLGQRVVVSDSEAEQRTGCEARNLKKISIGDAAVHIPGDLLRIREDIRGLKRTPEVAERDVGILIVDSSDECRG